MWILEEFSLFLRPKKIINWDKVKFQLGEVFLLVNDSYYFSYILLAKYLGPVLCFSEITLKRGEYDY